MNLAHLSDRVSVLLKALGGGKPGEASPVPNPPPDPDDLPTDTRMDGASPTEADLAQAGASQPPAQPDGGAPDGGAPAGGDGDGGEVDEDGRPLAKGFGSDGFDAFGNRDMGDEELRQLLKGFDPTPPTPDSKVKEGGTDVESILEAILQSIEHLTDVNAKLKKEVAELRRGQDEHGRSIAKALDTLQDPATAPAASPRSVVKALPGVAPAAAPAIPAADAATHLFEEVRAGRMSIGEARLKAREIPR